MSFEKIVAATVSETMQRELMPFLSEIKTLRLEIAELRESNERPLSIAECCDILQCDESTFYLFRKKHDIRSCVLSGKPLFRKSDILKPTPPRKKNKYD